MNKIIKTRKITFIGCMMMHNTFIINIIKRKINDKEQKDDWNTNLGKIKN